MANHTPRPHLFVVHATHVMACMVVGLFILVLATGHFALLVLLAATAFLFGCWCRFGGEGGGGHGERKCAQQIFGFHDYTPIELSKSRVGATRGGGVGGLSAAPVNCLAAGETGTAKIIKGCFKALLASGG